MGKITRRKDFSCVGDICYVYKLHKPIDNEFIKAVGLLGNLRELPLKKNTYWTLESEQGFTISTRLGATQLEVRFKRKRHDENLVIVERWLKSYFNDIGIQEEA